MKETPENMLISIALSQQVLEERFDREVAKILLDFLIKRFTSDYNNSEPYAGDQELLNRIKNILVGTGYNDDASDIEAKKTLDAIADRHLEHEILALKKLSCEIKSQGLNSTEPHNIVEIMHNIICQYYLNIGCDQYYAHLISKKLLLESFPNLLNNLGK